MRWLRNALYVTAACWAGSGIAVALFPSRILLAFGQPTYPDYAYVRATGILCAGMALLMVVVAQHLNEVWWWSWPFAITAASLATLSAANAIWGLPGRADSTIWWIFAAGNLVLTAGILLGMQAASHEKPFV
ncbi:MAG: hypothetical protein ABI828_03150 [Actinomycetota bacterium]